jgi:hypothetical protein
VRLAAGISLAAALGWVSHAALFGSGVAAFARPGDVASEPSLAALSTSTPAAEERVEEPAPRPPSAPASVSPSITPASSPSPSSVPAPRTATPPTPRPFPPPAPRPPTKKPRRDIPFPSLGPL